MLEALQGKMVIDFNTRVLKVHEKASKEFSVLNPATHENYPDDPQTITFSTLTTDARYSKQNSIYKASNVIIITKDYIIFPDRRHPVHQICRNIFQDNFKPRWHYKPAIDKLKACCKPQPLLKKGY